MPNQVLEGDAFTARFTVMNRTAQARTLAVRIEAPIFVAEEVIEESSIEFDDAVEDNEQVVERFKDFLDDVSPEDFLRDS